MSPAYLAGANGTAKVFEYVVREGGWGHSEHLDLSQEFAWSRDHRLRLADGQPDPGASWRITAAREALDVPDWMAGFSEKTPPEIISAVLAPLLRAPATTDWLSDLHPALQPPDDRRSLIRTLTYAGWHPTLREGVLDLEAPDQLARIRIRTQPPGDPLDLMAHCHLRVEVGPPGSGGEAPYWQGLFTASTPTVVADALAQALTSPTPLKRDRDWMDEDLLAHHDQAQPLGGAAPPDPAPHRTPAGGRPYTDADLRTAAIEVCALAMTDMEIVHGMPAEALGEEVIASSRNRAPTTWGQLPGEQRELAYLLVTDLVVAASGKSALLLGEPATLSTDARRRSNLPTPTVPIDLSKLPFTNDDLLQAATAAAAKMIHWVDPNGVGESLIGREIPSSVGTPHARTWDSLPEQDEDMALSAVYGLMHDAAARTAVLFDQTDGPEPFTVVTPLYLAGPGHDPGLAAKPLTDRGWSASDDGRGTVIYSSPCQRLSARSVTDAIGAPGSSWTLRGFVTAAGGSTLWRATADTRTPPEIVAAMNAVLAAGSDELFGPSRATVLGLQPVADAGWHDDSTDTHLMWAEPDAEMASIYRCTKPTGEFDGESTDWQLSGGKLDPWPVEGWNITMTPNVPEPLLRAVTSAMTDTAPVPRLGRDLTDEHLNYLDVRPLHTRATRTAPVRSTAAARSAAARAHTTLAPIHTPPLGTGPPSDGSRTTPDTPSRKAAL